jgi:hypothetical protein
MNVFAVAAQHYIQRLVNAIVGAMKNNSKKISRPNVEEGTFILTRDNKFDEFTLPDKISKIRVW